MLVDFDTFCVTEAPSGTLYRVTNEQGEWPFYDKCRVVVLRNGATGKRGRKLIKAFNDIDSWHLVKPSQMPTNDPSLPWNKL